MKISPYSTNRTILALSHIWNINICIISFIIIVLITPFTSKIQGERIEKYITKKFLIENT